MNITDKTKLIESILSRVSSGSALHEKLTEDYAISLHTLVSENKKRTSIWVTTSSTLRRVDAFLTRVAQDDMSVNIHDDYTSLLDLIISDMKLFIFLRGDYNPWEFESRGIINPEQEAALCLQL